MLSVGTVPGAGNMRLTRRRFLVSTAIAGTGLGFYTWRWEPHWLQIVERPLPIANLPLHHVGSRLVQLSDLHIGAQVDDAYLLKTFERVRNLKPDIVVYTGDFTTYDADVVSHARKIFNQLPLGRLATLGILGNHDYGPGWANSENAHSIVELGNDFGVRVLRNEITEIDGLKIVGLDDLWAQRFQPERVLTDVSRNDASLVLSHNPDSADEPGWGAYNGWILCGHTHGGQCKPPFLPPPLLPVRNRRYQAGEYALNDGRRLYINRGVGHTLQVRFNVRPEVTLFYLVAN
jgi:predicted MPP superfamily phosphohydrolase